MTKKVNDCGICNQHRSFVMSNKLVCLRCDELTFDLEIECDEEHAPSTEKGAPRTKPTMTVALPKK